MEEEKRVCENRLSNMLADTLDKLRGLADSNTIFGAPFSLNNSQIVPVSKATVGFVMGGGEYNISVNDKRHNLPLNFPMAGGTGGGVMLDPIGFLVDDGREIKFIAVSSNCEMTSMIISTLSKLYGSVFNK